MRIRWGLQSKLIGITIFCAVGFVLLATPALNYYTQQTIHREATKEQKQAFKATESSAAIAAFVGNEVIAEEVIDSLMLKDIVYAVKLTSNDGLNLSKSKAPKTPSSSLWEGAKSFPLYSPSDDSVQVGSLLLVENSQYIKRKVERRLEQFVYLLLSLTVFLVVTLLFAVRFVIGSPLQNLSAQLNEITPQKVNKVNVRKGNRRDEVGLVANQINMFIDSSEEALATERDLRMQIEKMDRHYRSIFSSSKVGMLVLDKHGTLIHGNPIIFDKMLNVSDTIKQHLNEMDFFNLLFKEPDSAWALVKKSSASGETLGADLELKNGNSGTDVVHCLISANRDPENPDEWTIEAVLHDISSRVKQEQFALKMAEEDMLTGLKNRRGCEQFFNQWQQSQSEDHLVIYMLDLDNFKPVNDTYGHSAGDEVLRTIAKRLHFSVRSSRDLVGRLGGDEFILMLQMEKPEQQNIEDVAEKILAQITKPILLSNDKQANIGSSIGITVNTRNQATSYDEMLENADQAMYQVKQHGKNNFLIHQTQLPAISSNET